MSTMDKINIGDSSSFSKTITENDVISFAEISGDHNPVHLNEEYAKTTMFGKRIAHGLLSASFISNVLANQLPGPGTIYLEQNLKFIKPVFWGDNVTATVTVTEKNEKKEYIKLETVVTNQHNEKVIIGSATVIPPKRMMHSSEQNLKSI